MELVKQWMQLLLKKIPVLITALLSISMNITPVYAISNNQAVAINNPTINQPIFKTEQDYVYANDVQRQYPATLDQAIVSDDKNGESSAIMGKPVQSIAAAKKVLSVITQAEGLQTTSVTFLKKDQSGNYLFSVWYKNFPHNIRIVTYDGYVVEDMDS